MTGRDVDTSASESEQFLADERDFLLASLRDLEAEYAAGDMSDDDYATLKADYTTRAAAVIRRLAGEDDDGATDDSDSDGDTPSPASPWRRRLVGVGLVAVIAVGAGVLVAQSSGRRGGSGLTGLDVSSASNRVGQCQQLEVEEDVDAALDCYDGILEALPANVPALTFRGWLQVRSFDLEAGLADLDEALSIAPDQTAGHIFRASARMRSGDPRGAVADLAAFYANDPTDEERGLAAQFTPTIVEGALDECIGGDVSGALDAESVAGCYRDILAVDDGNPTAQVYLGWRVARNGQSDDAMALFDAALETAPDATAGYVFRAALRAHVGDVDGALADLDEFDRRAEEGDLAAAQVDAAGQVRTLVEAGVDPMAVLGAG